MERKHEPEEAPETSFVVAEQKLSAATFASTVIMAAPRRDSGIITEFTERRQELSIVLRRLVRLKFIFLFRLSHTNICFYSLPVP